MENCLQKLQKLLGAKIELKSLKIKSSNITFELEIINKSKLTWNKEKNYSLYLALNWQDCNNIISEKQIYKAVIAEEIEPEQSKTVYVKLPYPQSIDNNLLLAQILVEDDQNKSEEVASETFEIKLSDKNISDYILPQDAYSAKIELVSKAHYKTFLKIKVNVTNSSPVCWDVENNNLKLAVVARWKDPDGSLIVPKDSFVYIKENINPQESRKYELLVNYIPENNYSVLEIDLCNESNRNAMFSTQGSKSLSIKIEKNLNMVQSLNIDEELNFYLKRYLELFEIKENKPCFSAKQSGCKHKTILVSLPKCGTYFATKLLTNIGVVHPEVHLNSLKTNFKKDPLNKVTLDIPFEVAVNLLQSGQFAPVHLPYSQEYNNILSGYKILFMYRNIKDALISHMRWSEQHLVNPAVLKFKNIDDPAEKIICYMQTTGKNYLRTLKNIIPWIKQPYVLGLCYEQLYGDLGKEKQLELLDGIYDYLQLEKNNVDFDKIITETVGVPTKTWTGKRSNWRDYWSDGVQNVYEQVGAKEINDILGYED